jgi:hypothetical protein
MGVDFGFKKFGVENFDKRPRRLRGVILTGSYSTHVQVGKNGVSGEQVRMLFSMTHGQRDSNTRTSKMMELKRTMVKQ